MQINRKTAVIIFGAEDAVLGPPPKLDGPHSPVDKGSISFSDVLIGCITVILPFAFLFAFFLVATEAYGSGYQKKEEIVPCKWEIKVKLHCEPFNRPVDCEWQPAGEAVCRPVLSEIGPVKFRKGLRFPTVEKDGFHKCPGGKFTYDVATKRFRCPPR